MEAICGGSVRDDILNFYHKTKYSFSCDTWASSSYLARMLLFLATPEKGPSWSDNGATNAGESHDDVDAMGIDAHDGTLAGGGCKCDRTPQLGP
jgi:hypothetical protein